METKSSKEIIKKLKESGFERKDSISAEESGNRIKNNKVVKKEERSSNVKDWKDYEKHIDEVRKYYVQELKQKHGLRIVSMIIAIILLVIFIVSMGILYRYLLKKDYEFSDKLLLGITVTVFISIIGLVTIVFKYSFSKTKDTTDYLNDTHTLYESIKTKKRGNTERF